MLDLREYSEDEVPVIQWAAEWALEVAKDVEIGWQKENVYDKGVQVYTKYHGRDFWAARVSEHKGEDYQVFKTYLLENHTKHESQYIDMIKGFKSLSVPDVLNDWHSEQITYKFPSPFNDREMVVWLTGEETKPGSQFVVISMPRKLDTPGTRGMYLSVEVVEKTKDGVKWIMAQTSDAGGWLPRWVQRKAVASSIAKDVPLFLQWVGKQPKPAPHEPEAAV